jgi:acetylornithine deacetylase
MSSMEVHNSTQELLMELISIPSVRGHEGPAMRHLYSHIKPHVDQCELIKVDAGLMDDPNYAFPLPNITYIDTPNLECVIRGNANGRRLIFNTHIDVVPPSEGQDDAFFPIIKNGIVKGRGACDAKGQIAVLYAVAMILRERNILPPGDVVFHFVFEEENGGNGTLAMIRRGINADAAVVLEPTGMAVIPAIRGAVWFQLKTFGRSGHGGYNGETLNALKLAVEAMEILERYHDILLAKSRGNILFDSYKDPMPINFGQIEAGTWPASVPSEAILKGVLGFLPNKNRLQVQEEMKQYLLQESGDLLRENFVLSFPMLNSDGYSIDIDHSLVKAIVKSVIENGRKCEIKALTASCDAWLYNNIAGIPTVVFGPGSIQYAHSKGEQIEIDDILSAASILVDFICTYGKRDS